MPDQQGAGVVTRSIGDIAKQIVEQQITACSDPAERKELILIAREAQDWIAICEARAA